MADLLTAVQKQIEYAGNEFASGDNEKGQAHLDKAAAFIQRAAGSTAAAPAGDSEATAESLSTDPGVAIHQILASVGHPVQFGPNGETLSVDGAAVAGAASEEQVQQLALLGFFGTPGTADVDYSLFEQYYEATGDGNWAPKAEYVSTGAWADYLANQ